MIPLRDSVRSRSRPVVMYAILGINALVFWHELSLGRDVAEFFHQYGLIARDFWQAKGIVDRVAPIVTSMFIHVGWVHFLGNMLYLWVFGITSRTAWAASVSSPFTSRAARSPRSRR